MGEKSSNCNQAVVGTELNLPCSEPAAGKWESPHPSQRFLGTLYSFSMKKCLNPRNTAEARELLDFLRISH